MPMKPVKRGIKIRVLADSTNGLSGRVVKDLTSDFLGKRLCVHFDNLFTSKKLICELEGMGIYGCGTTRSLRNLT